MLRNPPSRALALCILLPALAAAAPPPDRAPRLNPEAPATAYINGKWYEASESGARFVPGERYAIAGVFTAKRPAHVEETVDLGGGFVVPPFGEAHNHNVDGPWTAKTAERYLEQGIYYYKNPNDVGPITAMGADLYNRPDALDAVFAHGGLSIDEGHPEKLYRGLADTYRLDPEKLDGKAFFDLPTVAAVDRRWPEILAGRPDFLKLYLLNAKREGDGVSKGLAPEVVRRIAELAREAGIRTTAHVDTAADLALAVEAGVDEAAHLPGRALRNGLGAEAYRISDDLARRMAQRGFVVVTTTRVTPKIAARNEAIAAQQEELYALQVENLRRLHAAGVPLAIGTDVYQETSLDEARHLRELGAFTDPELLRLWVETAPVSIFPRRAIGRLEPGYEASFVALACDPAADFECVTRIRKRIKQGVVLPEPEAADRPEEAP